MITDKNHTQLLAVNNTAIIIFTKDRPKILAATLSNIKKINLPVVILDDSCEIQNKKAIQNLTHKYKNVTYHGQSEQKKLVTKTGLDNTILKPFINKLGVKKWNLGHVRNYAILLSRASGFHKILLMDDDIIIPDTQLIVKIFEKLNHYNFVGSKVTGMEDDSVVGHIVRKLRLEPEEYYSGGFIACRPLDINEYFMNQYNEDWIWMYLHNFKMNFILYGKVLQQPFDPFLNWKKKVISQEIGELLVDGIKEAYELKNISLLTKPEFWQRVINEKHEYYSMLSNLCQQKGFLDMQKIINFVSKYSLTIEPSTLLNTYKIYFKQRGKWLSILSKADGKLLI